MAQGLKLQVTVNAQCVQDFARGLIEAWIKVDDFARSWLSTHLDQTTLGDGLIRGQMGDVRYEWKLSEP